MASGNSVSVGHTSPVPVAGDLGAAVDVHVAVSTHTVYFGGSDVTALSGYPVAAAGTLAYHADPGEIVYAICGGTDTATLSVLTVRSRT